MDDLDLFSHYEDEDEEMKNETSSSSSTTNIINQPLSLPQQEQQQPFVSQFMPHPPIPKENENSNEKKDEIINIEKKTSTNENSNFCIPVPKPHKRKLSETVLPTLLHETPLPKKKKFISCQHEVCYPRNYEPPNERTFNMGVKPHLQHRTYSFKLDKFQEESISCIEQNESVLVSAHTSAGKTVVAEYAIAISLKEKSRCIYTSPIKALSNQKYRDLQEEFKDVGLITGDVTISPNANCLVMTTEILRTMLYKGHELLTSVRWVIFDEVHYLRDPNRGVVWEEAIILLPNSVKYIFLSATVPNASEFASWVCDLKRQPIHVIYTDERPVPLRHYVYPANGKGIFLIKDENNYYKEDNWNRLMIEMSNSSLSYRNVNRKGGLAPKYRSETIYNLLKMIVEREFYPCIFFAFSRKQCEEYAVKMKKLSLTEDLEKSVIEEVFNNAVEALNEEDQKLPQITNMLPLIKRGIGIHHSGLLPIMKEIIEILFQEGLIKCLFATETFSMGLNMPAKTCVFVNLEKFTGVTTRPITSGEYIQMSGRAGRRGIDKKGIVISILETASKSHTLRGILSGDAAKLNSAFYLSFFTVLNLLRVEGISPKYIIERSFFKFQAERKIPEMKKQLERTIREFESIEIVNENVVEQFYLIKKELDFMTEELNKVIIKPLHCLPFLQTGRILKVKDNWGYGIVLNFQKISELLCVEYVVDLLLPCKIENNVPVQIYTDFEKQQTDINLLKNAEMCVLPVKLNLLKQITSIRIYVSPNLKISKNKELTKARLIRTMELHGGRIPILDPISEMKISNLDGIVGKIQMLEEKLELFPEDLKDQFCVLKRKLDLKNQIGIQKSIINSVGQEKALSNLMKMKNVLKTLGYIDNNEILTKKGRLAAEISTGDLLVATELLLNTKFSSLDEETMGALLSCLVYDNTKEFNLNLISKHLQSSFNIIKDTIMLVVKVKKNEQMDVNQLDELKKFSPALIEVTYNWLKGKKFYHIAKSTDVYEGEIIRIMRRLEELLRQLILAVKTIGEKNLEKKLTKCSSLLKRDIIFSASLYL